MWQQEAAGVANTLLGPSVSLNRTKKPLRGYGVSQGSFSLGKIVSDNTATAREGGSGSMPACERRYMEWYSFQSGKSGSLSMHSPRSSGGTPSCGRASLRHQRAGMRACRRALAARSP